MSKDVSRRRLLEAGGSALAAGLAPAIINPGRARAQPKTLKILQWKHFVPGHDEWFNNTYVKEWGEQNDTQVIVDNVGFADVTRLAKAEVEAQRGHDLVLFIPPPTEFQDQTIDHREIYGECERRYGAVLDFAFRSTYNPKTNKCFGFCGFYQSALITYRKDLWDAVHVAPDSWEDILAGGRRIKLLHQSPVGFSLASEQNSAQTMRAIMYSFGSSEQDEHGNRALRSKQTLEAIKYVKHLYEEAMIEDVLTWDAAANNLFMLNGEGCLTLDTLSIARASESTALPIAKDLWLGKAPQGPTGRLAPSFGFHTYVIWNFAENIDGAKQFLVDYIGQSREAFLASGFQNAPAFPDTAPDLATVVANDPAAGSPGKYALLAGAATWTTNLGHPGHTTPAIGEIFNTGIIPTMFAQAATGRLTPEERSIRRTVRCDASLRNGRTTARSSQDFQTPCNVQISGCGPNAGSGESDEGMGKIAVDAWSRRRLLKVGGAAALLAGAAPAIFPSRARARPKTLKALQWKNFIPAYDQWFDEVFVRQWSERNDTEVLVEKVGLADLSARAKAEAEAQRGHDLVLFWMPPAVHEDRVIDHREIYEECARRYGKVADFALRSTYNPRTRKHIGFCPAYQPAVLTYRKDLWDGVGSALDSWADVLAGGRQIRLLHEKPVGLGLVPEPNSEQTLRAIMYSFGASEQDVDGNPGLKSKATLEALKFVKTLYEEAMIEDVLSWDPISNNRFILNGEGCLIHDTIAILRTAETMPLPIAGDLALAQSPEGPAGRLQPSFGFYTYCIWSFAENIDGAKQFLVDYTASLRDAFLVSGFHTMPSFADMVPDLPALVAGDAGPGAPGKYSLVAEAAKWTTNVGHPGHTTPAIAETYDKGLIPTMFARAATGRLTPEEALDQADREVREIFEKWNGRG